MDPSDNWVQDTWAAALAKIFSGGAGPESGVPDAIYLDQLSCSYAQACWWPSARAVSARWSSGTRALLRVVEAAVTKAKGQPVAMVSEEMDEVFQEPLSGFLSLDPNLPSSLGCTGVPAYPSVYGGWSYHLGDIRWPGNTRGNVGQDFRAIVAQQLVDGRAIGWFSADGWAEWLDKPQNAATLSLLVKAAHTRVAFKDFLVHGRLWRPPTVTIDSTLQSCVADHSHRRGEFNVSCCAIESIITSAWIAADGGSLAVLLVNHMVQANASSSIGLDAIVNVSIPSQWAQRCCQRTPSVDIGVDLDRGVATIAKRVAWADVDTIVLRPRTTGGDQPT